MLEIIITILILALYVIVPIAAIAVIIGLLFKKIVQIIEEQCYA